MPGECYPAFHMSRLAIFLCVGSFGVCAAGGTVFQQAERTWTLGCIFGDVYTPLALLVLQLCSPLPPLLFFFSLSDNAKGGSPEHTNTLHARHLNCFITIM